MLLGLITDIHNHHANLDVALSIFRHRNVDQVLTIGDTCDAFSKGHGAARVASLLDSCNVVGVWGNHDFSLCRDVSETARTRFGPVVLDVMSRMHPQIVVDDCHFSHKESSVDPFDVAQLWDISDTPPDLWERAGHAFRASPHRLQFVGHYHNWWAATPAGQLNWLGNGPLHFEPSERYFVVIAATCNGWCAILDTENGILEPLRCESN